MRLKKETDGAKQKGKFPADRKEDIRRTELVRARRGPWEGLAALESENEGVNGDSFGERHADNGDHENVAEGTGVAAHGLGGGEAGQTDADAGAGTGDAEGEGTVDGSEVAIFRLRQATGAAAWSMEAISIIIVLFLSLVGLVLHAAAHSQAMVTGGKGMAAVSVSGRALRPHGRLLMGGGELDKDRAEKGENHSLEDAHEDFQEVERQGMRTLARKSTVAFPEFTRELMVCSRFSPAKTFP